VGLGVTLRLRRSYNEQPGGDRQRLVLDTQGIRNIHLDSLDVSANLVAITKASSVQEVLDDGILVVKLAQRIRHYRL